nr:carotenoid 9,10(9',10')-cleavage dioxygenase 1 [Quercus suber]
MTHGLCIKDGKATYVSCYVRTSRIKQEEYFGGAKFMKIGDLKGMFGLFMVNMHLLRAKLKVLDVSYGYGMVEQYQDGSYGGKGGRHLLKLGRIDEESHSKDWARLEDKQIRRWAKCSDS